MNKIFLTLLSYPIFFAPLISLLMLTNPAHAKELVFTAPQQPSSCERTSRMSNLVCVRGTQTNQSASTVNSDLPSDDEVPFLNFSEEESETAIALYGCDCIACINALRQSRGLPPLL
ncbi:MAG: hypothetical protein AB4426_00385 [Xenococcaceae cyanobacterium]